MALTIKGNSIGATWGTNGSATGAALANGIILRAETMLDGKTKELPNNEGETIGEVLYDDRHELSVDVLCGSGTTEPARGDAFAVGGRTGYVLSATLNWENEGWKSLKIKARKRPLFS